MPRGWRGVTGTDRWGPIKIRRKNKQKQMCLQPWSPGPLANKRTAAGLQGRTWPPWSQELGWAPQSSSLHWTLISSLETGQRRFPSTQHKSNIFTFYLLSMPMTPLHFILFSIFIYFRERMRVCKHGVEGQRERKCFFFF